MDELSDYIKKSLEDLDLKQRLQKSYLEKIELDMHWLREEMKQYRNYLGVGTNHPYSVAEECENIIIETGKCFERLEEIEERLKQVERLLNEYDFP